MVDTMICPTCGAPLNHSGNERTIHCSNCNSAVIVPDPSSTQSGPALTLEQEAAIKRRVLADKKIEAIKLYRKITGAGLAEAKAAVEAMQKVNPVPSSLPIHTDTPILNGIIGTMNKIKGYIKKIQDTFLGIFFGVMIIGVSLIFPFVFLPISYDSWKSGDIGGCIGSLIPAVIWFLVWGPIGYFLIYSTMLSYYRKR